MIVLNASLTKIPAIIALDVLIDGIGFLYQPTASKMLNCSIMPNYIALNLAA